MATASCELVRLVLTSRIVGSDPTDCRRRAFLDSTSRLLRSGSQVLASGGSVGQPDDVFGDPVACNKAERQPRAGEEWLAATKHDWVQVASILINEIKVSETPRQIRSGDSISLTNWDFCSCIAASTLFAIRVAFV